MEIDAASVDTNHAERDKHLREEDFLDVKRCPRAVFRSTKYMGTAEKGTLEGVLTLHGVSTPIRLTIRKVGEGTDPWGGIVQALSRRLPCPAATSASITIWGRRARPWRWSLGSKVCAINAGAGQRDC